MNNFSESKNNYKFNFISNSFSNSKLPLSFKEKCKLKVNAIPNIDRTLENINSIFTDQKKSVINPTKFKRLREYLIMKYSCSKNNNIKVLNSIRSTRQDKEACSYYNKLNPHLQKLVIDKGHELANLIVKEDTQQNKPMEHFLQKSDLKFSFQNFDIAALKGSPHNSIFSSSKINCDCKCSNSVESLAQNIKSDRLRNIQRSCLISPIQKPNRLEESFLTENSQRLNNELIRSFDRRFNFQIDVTDKENEKLVKLVEFNESSGNSSRISFMSKRYRAINEANSRQKFFESTHKLDNSQIYKHQYNAFDIDEEIRKQTEENSIYQ